MIFISLEVMIEIFFEITSCKFNWYEERVMTKKYSKASYDNNLWLFDFKLEVHAKFIWVWNFIENKIMKEILFEFKS